MPRRPSRTTGWVVGDQQPDDLSQWGISCLGGIACGERAQTKMAGRLAILRCLPGFRLDLQCPASLLTRCIIATPEEEEALLPGERRARLRGGGVGWPLFPWGGKRGGGGFPFFF